MTELKTSVLALLRDGDIRSAISELLLEASRAIARKPTSSDGDLEYSQIVPSWSVGALKRQLQNGEISQEHYDDELPKRESLQTQTLNNLRRAQTAQFSLEDAMWLDVISKMLKKSKGATVSTAFITYRRRNRPDHLKTLRTIQAMYGIPTLEQTFLDILEDRIEP